MSRNMIEIEHVSKVFNTDKRSVKALDNINLCIPAGEFTVLIGPSGCGKSTLLYLAAGFEQPTEGKIMLDGSPITKPGPDRGFVFQEYALFPWQTVLANVKFGLLRNGWNRREAHTRAMDYVRLVHLSGFENAYPHTLSGGMKQRVGIARALAYDPKVLLMDEPFGALDSQTRKLMQQELTEIWQVTKKTVLFVTHSVIEAVYLADRIVVFTARPGTVKGSVSVDVARPRGYTEEHYLDIRHSVLDLLEEEVTKGIQNKSSQSLPH